MKNTCIHCDSDDIFRDIDYGTIMCNFCGNIYEDPNIVTWLHLSDFHFDSNKQVNYEQDLVLSTLLDDINKTFLEKNKKIDFIVISGDIAFSGLEADYKFAETFFNQLLEITKLSKDKLLLIPGNHDVDWDLISKGDKSICDSLEDNTSVNTFFKSKKDRDAIFNRQRYYYNFLENYLMDNIKIKATGKYFSKIYDINNHKIGMIGLNTSWLSDDEDYLGKLLIGKPQLTNALNDIKNVKTKIVILHHPFEWFKTFDRNYAESILRNNCDFILRGHMHRQQIIIESSLEGISTIIPAGACYETYDYPNCYNIVSFNLLSKEGIIYLRQFSNTRKEWVKDIVSTGDINDGKVKFNFRLRNKFKPNPLLPKEYNTILKIIDFKEHLNSIYTNKPEDTHNTITSTYGDYYNSRIDEIEKSFKNIPIYSRFSFIEMILYDGAIKKYKPFIEYIKDIKKRENIKYSLEKISLTFVKYIINEYFVKKKEEIIIES